MEGYKHTKNYFKFIDIIASMVNSYGEDFLDQCIISKPFGGITEFAQFFALALNHSYVFTGRNEVDECFVYACEAYSFNRVSSLEKLIRLFVGDEKRLSVLKLMELVRELERYFVTFDKMVAYYPTEKDLVHFLRHYLGREYSRGISETLIGLGYYQYELINSEVLKFLEKHQLIRYRGDRLGLVQLINLVDAKTYFDKNVIGLVLLHHRDELDDKFKRLNSLPRWSDIAKTEYFNLN